MTQDEIIRIAREAGVDNSWDLNWFDPYFERFAALVAAHEREACAKICEELGYDLEVEHRCATAIRARSMK